MRLFRKRAGEGATERRLRALVSQAPSILFVVDLEGRVVMAEGRLLLALGRADSVLLIEQDSSVFNEIKSLLAFVGYDTVLLSDAGQLADLLQDKAFSAVLLGKGQAEHLNRTLRVMAEAGKSPAVILLNFPEDHFNAQREQWPFVIANLALPLRHEPVIEH